MLAALAVLPGLLFPHVSSGHQSRTPRPAARTSRASHIRLSEDAAAQGRAIEQLRSDLDVAVSCEEYSRAATLRDELDRLMMDDELSALAANTEFYSAFSAGDLKRMEALWAKGDGCACSHPGFAPIHGYSAVMESWGAILSGKEMGIQPERVRCILVGGSAVVTCIEKLGDNSLTATNVYAKADGKWRMVLHQAAPLMQPIVDPPSTD